MLSERGGGSEGDDGFWVNFDILEECRALVQNLGRLERDRNDTAKNVSTTGNVVKSGDLG